MGSLIGIESFAQTSQQLIASKHVMIRTRLEPSGPVYVGQKVNLVVEVLTKNWFSKAPRYPTSGPEVERAITPPPEVFGSNFSERIGGESYAGQARTFFIYPQTTGRFTVPPMEVVLVVALDGAKPSPEIPLRTREVTFEARWPEAAVGLGNVVSTTGLTVRERYEGKKKELKVGDSFTRTLTSVIRDAPAMLAPVPAFEAEEGISIYSGRPEVTEKRGRGEMTGTRVDKVTYVLEREGEFTLPEIVIPWWNLNRRRIQRITLPEVQLTVAANPDLEEDLFAHLAPEEPEAEGVEEAEAGLWETYKDLIPAAAIVVLLLAILLRFLLRRHARKAGSGTLEEDPEAYYRRFRKACRDGDPKGALRELMFWLDRTYRAETAPTLEGFAAGAGDADLLQRSRQLLAGLFSSTGSTSAWDGRDFLRSVSQARKRKAGTSRSRSNTLNPRVGNRTP